MVLSQGKFFWDLFKARKDEPVALVRVEEVYPFPKAELEEALKPYGEAGLVWAQEEPENMGAWHFVERRLRAMGVEPTVVAREESASPATGSMTIHQEEQQKLIGRALEREQA